MNELIITNNPKVNIEFADKTKVDFEKDASQLDILLKARDYIHLGAKLVMHPMLGRIKPHETPYKSVFLENIRGELDFQSLTAIEDSILETKKFLENTFEIKYNDSLLDDLQYIDCILVKSGFEEYRR